MEPEEQINDQELITDDSEQVDIGQEMQQFEPMVIKPKNNIYTLLMLISLIFTITAIYLVGWELRNFYDATFGILSPKENQSISESAPVEKTTDTETENTGDE